MRELEIQMAKAAITVNQFRAMVADEADREASDIVRRIERKAKRSKGRKSK